MDTRYIHLFNYTLTVNLQDPILYLTIESIDNDMVRLFRLPLTNSTLCEKLQLQFKNIDNIHNYLVNKDNFEVNPISGVITLILLIGMGRKIEQIRFPIELAKIKQYKLEEVKNNPQIKNRIQHNIFYNREQKLQKMNLEQMVQSQKINENNNDQLGKKLQKMKKQIMKQKKKISIRMQNKKKQLAITTQFSNRFQVKQNTVEMIQNEGTQFLINKIIQKKRVFRFQLKIIKRNGPFEIGVVDINKQKYSRLSYNSGNAVCYGYGGKIHYGNQDGLCKFKKQGNGYKTGDYKGKMKWYVNDKIEAQIYSFILRQSDRQFVPFFQMCWKGGKIQYIGQ